ncbi:serine/threonine-protein kinase [Streptomyces sp. NPDC050504]|uniref:serine/threonine-protein kinase n=1 Tax=Streptomyces sp. NPDC050504 TaxID=3365618 RepID=UPI0037A9163E
MDKPGNLGPGDPARIGAYRIVGRLGAGGMGQVYLARTDRGRTVAIKLVRQELAEQQEFRDRFRAEVGAARRVGGRLTAAVLDADTEADVPWVATAYVPGPSLHTVVSTAYGPLPERSVRLLAAGLAQALRDIHAAGIVHRDLKPSNVLLTIDGPVVIDFGIARALESLTAGGEGGLTRTGALVGSPGFMAPEQVRGEQVTPACDVFCLGSVLAYAATGRLPFGSADSGAHAVMFRIAQEEPDLEGVPQGLHGLIRDCLHKDPAARPDPAAVLARAERRGSGGTGPGGTLADAASGNGAAHGAPGAAHSGPAADGEPWLPSALVAQLGRHAVQLLHAEDPAPLADGSVQHGTPAFPTPTFAEPSAPPAPATPPSGHPAFPGRPTPPSEPTAPPAHTGPPAPAGPPVPTAQTGPTGGAPQGQQPGYGAYPPFPPSYTHYSPPEPEPPRPTRRATAALVAVAIAVAVGAGGSVYAYMKSGPDKDADPSPTRSATGGGAGGQGAGGTDGPGPTDTPPSPSPSPSGSATADGGVVPAGLIGTWETTLSTGAGTSTRSLTIVPGDVGDTVLTLTAKGPTDGGGTYRCVFSAQLTEKPAPGGQVRIGPTTVDEGEPMSSCTPGGATTLTLLPDGRLKRVVNTSGDQLTYTKGG